MILDWNKTCISYDASIEAAIKILTELSLRIVLVVNEADVLLGTVTDGDVRRGILRGKSISDGVSEIMCSEPIVIQEGLQRRQILKMMTDHDLLHLPIVNIDGKVVGLEIMHELLSVRKKTNTVLLMAGGFGTRLYPLTRAIPKPLLKVGGKPILELILDQFIENGFEKFYFSVHYHAEQIKSYFGNGRKWGVEIEYLDEERPLGTAGALGLIPPNESTEPILIANGDLLTNVDFDQLIDYHCSHGGAATVCVREYDFEVPYGVLQVDDLKVHDIVEKPTHKYLINAGIYVLDPRILPRGEDIQTRDMPDFLKSMMMNGDDIYVFPIYEYWLDIGHIENLKQAAADYAEDA